MGKLILNTAFLLIFKRRSTESINCCQIFNGNVYRQQLVSDMRSLCLLSRLTFWARLNIREPASKVCLQARQVLPRQRCER